MTEQGRKEIGDDLLIAIALIELERFIKEKAINDRP